MTKDKVLSPSDAIALSRAIHQDNTPASPFGNSQDLDATINSGDRLSLIPGGIQIATRNEMGCYMRVSHLKSKGYDISLSSGCTGGAKLLGHITTKEGKEAVALAKKILSGK